MNVNEPIEIRFAIVPQLQDGTLLEPQQHKTLVVENRHGVLWTSLSRTKGGGVPEPLSTLQPGKRGNVAFPRKAVEGWQEEVLEWANTCLYRVLEVR